MWNKVQSNIHVKRGFSVPMSLQCRPLLIGIFEPENGSFDRDFEAFSVPASKVPNFNILSGEFFSNMATLI